MTPFGRRLLDRRSFMKNTGFSLGGLGLAQLLAGEGLSSSENPAEFSGKSPIRPDIDPDNPYLSRKGHFEGAAKQVLVIYCPGAVSHVDTFDYKPALAKFHGHVAGADARPHPRRRQRHGKPVQATHFVLLRKLRR